VYNELKLERFGGFMRILNILKRFLIVIILFAVIFVGTLTVFEYKPKDVENVIIENNQDVRVKLNESMTFMTFNIGYAGLGENEDFVLDGGTNGIPENKDIVLDYLAGIQETLLEYPVDFYLLQEVDLKSRRSYKINQLDDIHEDLGTSYSYQFAYNFKSLLVPFPLSLTDYIGYVESGIATFANFRVEESKRFQFPGEFSWPLRVANLKRAMMVSRLEIEGSTKELVIVNLHMSAYDGDGSLRAQEMQFLRDFMEIEKDLGNYVVVGGDFNQTFPEANGIYPVTQDFYEAFPIENDFLPNGYSFMVDLTKPTCRLLNQPYDPSSANTQYYIIDGFIVSSNIEVEKFQDTQTVAGALTIDLEFENSDHNPVVMKIKLLP
jgi:endonuclease/exonuclease/phosphatase family metal-dependent hydrolase